MKRIRIISCKLDWQIETFTLPEIDVQPLSPALSFKGTLALTRRSRRRLRRWLIREALAARDFQAA